MEASGSPLVGSTGAVSWTALLLAGQRSEHDPLAAHFGQTHKALIPVAERSMLARVAEALLECPRIGRIVVMAQQPDCLLKGDTADLARDPRVRLAVSGSGIAASIARLAGSETAPWPLLVTTADHALLTAAMLDEFLDAASAWDISIGVGARSLVERQYPSTRRTWLRFSDDGYSGTNLFALRDAATLPALELWSTVERDRKKAWRILSSFGPWLMLRALTRTISLDAALAAAGRRLGVRAGAVTMSQAEAVIDVDKLADWELVESIIRQRQAL